MIQLPTERSKVESYNPKFMIIGGRPKAGKSTCVSALENNLIIDLEDGYRSLSVLKVQARNMTDLMNIREAIVAKGREMKKIPYKFITIDNASRLEEQTLGYAAELYRATTMGANFGIIKDEKGLPIKDAAGKIQYDPKADIRTLANGAG